MKFIDKMPCEREGCTKAFKSKRGMTVHMKDCQTGIRHPCKREGCRKDF